MVGNGQDVLASGIAPAHARRGGAIPPISVRDIPVRWQEAAAETAGNAAGMGPAVV